MLHLRHYSAVILLFVIYLLSPIFDFRSLRLSALVWILIGVFLYFVWPHIYGNKEKVFEKMDEYSSSGFFSIRESFGMAYAALFLVSLLFFAVFFFGDCAFSFYNDRCSIACAAIVAFFAHRKMKECDAIQQKEQRPSDD